MNGGCFHVGMCLYIILKFNPQFLDISDQTFAQKLFLFLTVTHMKSVLDRSFFTVLVCAGFISVLAEAPVHAGFCEVCRSLLWVGVELALSVCGGLASICCCVVYWRCGDVVRETRL